MDTGLVRLHHEVRAMDVKLTEDALTVELDDARTLTVPILWFPRLSHATADERNHWELIGTGEGIQWPDLDEDIEVAALLLGYMSGESHTSLGRWLEARNGKRASA